LEKINFYNFGKLKKLKIKKVTVNFAVSHEELGAGGVETVVGENNVSQFHAFTATKFISNLNIFICLLCFARCRRTYFETKLWNDFAFAFAGLCEAENCGKTKERKAKVVK